MLQNKRAVKIITIIVAFCLLVAAAVTGTVYALQSRNAMAASEAGTTDGQYYIKMELPDTGNLAYGISADFTFEDVLDDADSWEDSYQSENVALDGIKKEGNSYIVYVKSGSISSGFNLYVFNFANNASLFNSTGKPFNADNSKCSVTFARNSAKLTIKITDWQESDSITISPNLAPVLYTVSYTPSTSYTVKTVTDETGTGAQDLSDPNWTVESGQKSYFTVTPKEANKSVTVLNGTVPLTPNEHNVYTLENVTKNIQLTIELADKTTSVTYTYTGAGETYVSRQSLPATAVCGQLFTFKMSPKEGYEITVTATSGKQAIDVHREGSEFTIAATDVKEQTINITVNVAKKGYHVTYNIDDEAVTLEESKDTAYYDEEFTVKVKLNAGYKWNSIKANPAGGGRSLTISGDTPTAGGATATFTIAAKTITDNFTVTISTSLGNYTVTGPEDPQGYTFSGDPTATYKTNYSFDIYPDEGYKIDSVSATISEKALIVTGSNGSYSISGTQITGNISISATVSIITYTVTFTAADGFTYTEVDGNSLSRKTVEHGNSLSFKLKANNGYDLSGVTVSFAGQTLQDAKGTYTIDSVTQDGSVTVTGVKMFSYSITLNSANGFKITSSNPNTNLTWGQTFEFTIAVDTGYDPTKYEVSLKHGDAELKDSAQETDSYYTKTSGTYKITVRSDVTVTVTVKAGDKHDGKLTYEVKDVAQKAVGYTLQIEGTTHYYDDNVTFTVTALDGYEVTAVLVNSVNAVKAGDKYVIADISENCTISVLTREYQLTITWSDAAHDVNETEPINYTDIPETQNRTLTTETYYQGAWKFGDEKATSVKELQDKVKKSDVSLTATAVWTFNENGLDKLIQYKAYFKEGSADDSLSTKADLVVELSTSAGHSDNSESWTTLLDENGKHGAKMILGFAIAALRFDTYNQCYENVSAAQTAWAGEGVNKLQQAFADESAFDQDTLYLLGEKGNGVSLNNDKTMFAYGVTYASANYCNFHFISNGRAMKYRTIAFYVAVSFNGEVHIIKTEMQDVTQAVNESASAMEAMLPESASAFENDEESPTIE